MKKITLSIALAPLLVQFPVQAQTPAVSNAPLIRDPKAIALFGQAVDAYKGLKTFSAVLQERNAAGGGEIYQLQWAPPGKAALLIRRIDAKRDGKFIADGKNVFRLLPDAPTFDRFPMRDASDADAVFTASPLLLFGIGPLLSGKNMAADEKIARGVTLGEIPSEAKEDLTAPVDVVQIQTVFPGESPDKLTDFIYAFDKTTHRLQEFWLRRPIEGQSKTASLLMQFEVLDTAPKADAFIWKAPAGVEEVPFAGLFAAPASTKTIQPTLEPAAIALLDKAAATYGELKTLQMRIAGTGWGFDMRTKVSSSLFYERPNKIRIEGRGDGELGLHVTDGKTLFYKDENGSFSNPLDSIAGVMQSLTFPAGKYLSDWTQGRHSFQPAILPDTLRDALLLEVIHLPARVLNGKNVEGVRIRSKYKETGRVDLFREEILWLKPEDGALARIQFQSRRGKRVGSGAIDIVSQSFNAPIPTSKFSVVAAKR